MKYFNIILFFASMTLFSQTNAKISYSVLPTGGSLEKNEEVVKSKVASSFIGVDDALTRLTYILVVKDQRSNFYLESMLDFNQRSARLARAFAGNNEFFKDQVKNQIIKKVDFSNEIFFVKVDSVSQWELQNEQKIINGYTCFKAVRNKFLRLKQKNSVHVIEAWYCPAIPIKNGPKEFGDLPGLILELQDDKITFLASKIELGSDLKLIIKEVNSKTISETEFYKIVEKTVENTTGSIR
jgi:GLPGLI family protein